MNLHLHLLVDILIFSHLYSGVDIFVFNGSHWYWAGDIYKVQQSTLTFNGWHSRSTNCNIPSLIKLDNVVLKICWAIKRLLGAAKAKPEKPMAIDRAVTLQVRQGLPKKWRDGVKFKICQILVNVILEIILFENEKWPFKD